MGIKEFACLCKVIGTAEEVAVVVLFSRIRCCLYRKKRYVSWGLGDEHQHGVNLIATVK
jgi:hypothetical protein